MDEAARDQLAQRLSAMSLKDARKEIRALDADANMKYFRNAIWDEYHTLFTLPNAGLNVILVEKGKFEQTDRKIGGGPIGWTALKAEYQYIEARVELLNQRK